MRQKQQIQAVWKHGDVHAYARLQAEALPQYN